VIQLVLSAAHSNWQNEGRQLPENEPGTSGGDTMISTAAGAV
jgi:hypothetical protein